MLFAAKYRGYTFTAVSDVDRFTHLDTGLPVRRGITCEFVAFGIPLWAQKQALESLGTPRGLGHDDDPYWRLSMYDTDQAARANHWDAETKAEVEERLLTGMGYGVDYVRVERPSLVPPWPTYDTLVASGSVTPAAVAKKIAQAVREYGHSVEHTIEYERDNLNRPEVIEALQAIVAPLEAESVEELVEA